VLAVIHATTGNIEAGAVGLSAFSAAWLPAVRRWSARAHLCWASSAFLFVAYLTAVARLSGRPIDTCLSDL